MTYNDLSEQTGQMPEFEHLGIDAMHYLREGSYLQHKTVAPKMDYITAKLPHFPGALTDDAVALFCTIQGDYMYIPDAKQMSKAQMDALHLLVKSGYIVSSGWYGFKARGAGWTGYSAPQPAPVDDLAAVEYIAVSKRHIIVMLKNGQGYNFRGEPEYLVGLKALAESLRPGYVLPGRNGVLAYGHMKTLLGKHSRIA